jgi:hypothetical protein
LVIAWSPVRHWLSTLRRDNARSADQDLSQQLLDQLASRPRVL